MDDPVLNIGPNTTLSSRGLTVDGRRAELRHIGDFKTFVLNTSSAVSTVLAVLLPETVAKPDWRGNAEPSSTPGWEHYSLLTMLLKTRESDALDHGRALLQWCLVAHCIGKLTGHVITRSAEYLTIAFLLEQGGQALSTSPANGESYALSRCAAFADALTGEEETDPRPSAMRVTIPWPEELGVDLGGPSRALANACAIAGDIVTGSRGTWLSVAGHAVRFAHVNRLVEAFDAQAQGSASSSVQIAVNVDGFLFKAQRNVIGDGGEREYCFRIVPATATILDRIVPSAMLTPVQLKMVSSDLARTRTIDIQDATPSGRSSLL